MFLFFIYFFSLGEGVFLFFFGPVMDTGYMDMCWTLRVVDCCAIAGSVDDRWICVIFYILYFSNTKVSRCLDTVACKCRVCVCMCVCD